MFQWKKNYIMQLKVIDKQKAKMIAIIHKKYYLMLCST